MQQIPNQHSIRLSGRDLHSTEISFVRIIIGAEFHGTGKQNSMRYLYAFGWISIIPRIRWRFFVLCGRDSRNGDPGPRNSNPPHPGLKGKVIVVMNGMI